MARKSKKGERADSKRFNRIAEVLKIHKISQYRLHKDSGIAYSQVNAYVQNKRQPSIETLFKIAKALGVSPRELLNS